jgi:hypothetical protein
MSIIEKIKLANEINREIKDFPELRKMLIQEVIDIFNIYGLDYKDQLEKFNKEFIENLKNKK